MSCFICSDNTFKNVAKSILMTKMVEGKRYYNNLEHLNELLVNIAELNLRAYNCRYGNVNDIKIELFDELPNTEITPMELKSVICYLYQCNESEAIEKTSIFQNVAKSIDFHLKRLNVTRKQVLNLKGGWE